LAIIWPEQDTAMTQFQVTVDEISEVCCEYRVEMLPFHFLWIRNIASPVQH